MFKSNGFVSKKKANRGEPTVFWVGGTTVAPAAYLTSRESGGWLRIQSAGLEVDPYAGID
jgi:hypothetical protein